MSLSLVRRKPLCFVLMPFNTKPDPAGGPPIDFDRIYSTAIRPGVEGAGLEPVRADEEQVGGIIHKAMFERLLMCDFAVADLTTANPNVLYELGVRHAARPRTTLTVHAAQRPLPFDVNLLRTEQYDLGDKNAFPAEAADRLRARITDRLRTLKGLAVERDTTDSPLFNLVTGWRPALPSAAAAEPFVAQVRATEEVNRRLRDVKAAVHDQARRPEAVAELAEIRASLLAGDLADSSILISLMLAYRAFGDWTGMIEVHDQLPAELAGQATVLQQLAFAYNRRAEAAGDPADRDRAREILTELERGQGPTAETCGLLGRIYKSQWQDAVRAGTSAAAVGFLRQAIKAYVRGFETDWREVYPGVNAVTLLDVDGRPASIAARDRLLPVVQFAAEQQGRSASPDYWAWATLLELAVLAGDQEKAPEYLAEALTAVTEAWQPKTTADNLRLILAARRDRDEPTGWIDAIVLELGP